MELDLKDTAQKCQTLAEQTGAILLDFWQQPRSLAIQEKQDGTPRTAADLAAHREIIQGLGMITPGVPVLSEEGQWPDYAERAQWPLYWLVDPLDGTRGFIAQLEQFSINIALVADHQPVLGIIYVPTAKTSYYAWQGGGAYKQVGADTVQQIQSRDKSVGQPWRIVLGQYSQGKRLSQLIRPRCHFQILHVNGSIKFGWLAEGQADIYPRLGAISEWDTAAGQCILTESGGAVVDLQGQTLQYNCKASLLNPDFIAVANADWVELWLEFLGYQ